MVLMISAGFYSLSILTNYYENDLRSSNKETADDTTARHLPITLFLQDTLHKKSTYN